MRGWENQDLVLPSSRGFVYIIINETNNMLYIGKKKLIQERRVAVAGRTNKKIIKTPSDWKTYFGSSVELKSDVRKLGKDNFRRVILGCFDDLHSNNYAEADLQFYLGVLSDGKHSGFKFYNRCIKINTLRDVVHRDYIKRVELIIKGLK